MVGIAWLCGTACSLKTQNAGDPNSADFLFLELARCILERRCPVRRATVVVTSQSQASLSAYRLDFLSGQLTPTVTVPTGSVPGIVAFRPQGYDIYTSCTGGPAISRYRLNRESSSLSDHLQTTGVAAAVSVAIRPGGEDLYVSDAGSSDVKRFRIATDGTLTANGWATTVGGGIDLAVSSDGTRLYSAYSAGTLFAHEVSASGDLTSRGSNTTAAAASALALSHDGAHIYVVSGTTIRHYTAEDTGPPVFRASSLATGNPSRALVVGSFLYVTMQGINTVSIYSRNSDGNLTFVKDRATCGAPLGIAADPEGSYLFVNCNAQGLLGVYRIEGSDLRPLASYSTPFNPGGVAVALDYL